MSHPYINPDQPEAFVDFPTPTPAPAGQSKCPKCQGHRGWNLRINAYPLHPTLPDNPDNRHRHAHFRASCDNCQGQGYVPQNAAEHVHQWQLDPNRSKTFRQTYICATCNAVEERDTSG